MLGDQVPGGPLRDEVLALETWCLQGPQGLPPHSWPVGGQGTELPGDPESSTSSDR